MGGASDPPSKATAALNALDGLVNRAISELDTALTKFSREPSSSIPEAAESKAESEIGRALQRIVVEVEAARATPPAATAPKQPSLDMLVQRAEEALLRFETCAKEERHRASHAGATAAEWERNAMLAVRAKDDDLARVALANKADALHRQSSFARHADLLDREAATLRELIETVRGVPPAAARR